MRTSPQCVPNEQRRFGGVASLPVPVPGHSVMPADVSDRAHVRVPKTQAGFLRKKGYPVARSDPREAVPQRA
jgi:hypothetical protein